MEQVYLLLLLEVESQQQVQEVKEHQIMVMLVDQAVAEQVVVLVVLVHQIKVMLVEILLVIKMVVEVVVLLLLDQMDQVLLEELEEMVYHHQ